MLKKAYQLSVIFELFALTACEKDGVLEMTITILLKENLIKIHHFRVPILSGLMHVLGSILLRDLLLFSFTKC